MKFIAIFMCFLLVGCAVKTEYGECVGLNSEKQPNLRYKVSAWNLAMGIVFFELFVPPIYVALEALECPVGHKPEGSRNESI